MQGSLVDLLVVQCSNEIYVPVIYVATCRYIELYIEYMYLLDLASTSRYMSE